MEDLLTTPMALDWQVASTFVEENWHGLAAVAWRMYQKHGRGVVVYNADKQKPTASGLLYHRTKYIHANGMGRYLLRYGFDLDALVEQYSPETSAVVFITWPYSELDRLYRGMLKGQIDPEEALEQARLVEVLQQAQASLPQSPSEEKKPPVVTVDVYTFTPTPPVCFAHEAN